jgi:cytochrome c oxidase subunit 2
MTLLWISIIVLFIILVSRIVRIFELSREIKGAESDDHIVTDKEGRNIAGYFVLFVIGFFAFFAWLHNNFSDKLLPESASLHGSEIDMLFNITMGLIIFVFVVMHIILAYQIYKNFYRKGRKAFYFAHSTKLELVWTIVPAVVLSGLIVYGLRVWNDVIYPDAKNPVVIELYAKQFGWAARYAGSDGQLGGSDFRLIDDANELGIKSDQHAGDDIIVKGEFHLPVNRPVLFKFRSRDVIHSAYMPHFRAQMNCVPGMETQFEFTPIKTTQDIREITKNPKYNYVLLCNKICGSSHFNMQMDIIVDSEQDFNKWISEQKTWGASSTPPPTASNL